jgi:periplasmic copper chaperone A
MSTTRPRPRRARLLTGVLAGAVLAVAAPVAASAHIHVTPTESAAAAATTLAFSFSHGCEESPTTALVIDIPEGVTNVVPVAQGGWSIERDTASNGTVSRVTFRADTPVDNGIRGEVALDLRFAEELADTDVAFPVTQVCADTETAWTQVAADGEAEPESPAPLVAVGAVAEEGDGHDGAGAAHHDGSPSATADSTPSAAASTDGAALWLGGTGLALGAAALVVALFALRRRRA